MKFDMGIIVHEAIPLLRDYVTTNICFCLVYQCYITQAKGAQVTVHHIVAILAIKGTH
jgi:hypothetical protein